MFSPTFEKTYSYGSSVNSINYVLFDINFHVNADAVKYEILSLTLV